MFRTLRNPDVIFGAHDYGLRLAPGLPRPQLLIVSTGPQFIDCITGAAGFHTGSRALQLPCGVSCAPASYSTVTYGTFPTTSLGTTPASAVIVVGGLTAGSSGMFLRPISAPYQPAIVSVSTSEPYASVLDGTGQVVATVPLSSSVSSWTACVGFRFFPGVSGSQIWVDGLLRATATAGAGYFNNGSSTTHYNAGTPSALGCRIAAVWPNMDIGADLMSWLTKDPSLLFEASTQPVYLQIAGGMVPTLSDLRPVNVTGSSTQWSLDYTF